MRHKNFHMRAQSAPYGAIFPKTVAYAKYDRASSNLSFTPRFFHSTGAITCPFRNGFPKTRRERPIFDPPILGHIHGLSFLWGAAIWEMHFATTPINPRGGGQKKCDISGYTYRETSCNGSFESPDRVQSAGLHDKFRIFVPNLCTRRIMVKISRNSSINVF